MKRVQLNFRFSKGSFLCKGKQTVLRSKVVSFGRRDSVSKFMKEEEDDDEDDFVCSKLIA